MANISILQSQKKAKKFIPIIIGAVLLGGLILLIILQGGVEGQDKFVGIEDSSQLLRKQVQDIKREVTLPEGFFGSEILGQFTPYEPIKAPAQWGRENPFAPFNPAEFVDQDAPTTETGGQESVEIPDEGEPVGVPEEGPAI